MSASLVRWPGWKPGSSASPSSSSGGKCSARFKTQFPLFCHTSLPPLNRSFRGLNKLSKALSLADFSLAALPGLGYLLGHLGGPTRKE